MRLAHTTAVLALAGLTIAAYPAGDSRPDADPTAAWNVDAAHTEVVFSVRHFFTPVTGTFEDFEVDLEFDRERPERSKVAVRIAVASVNTRNEKRDNHLRSADWFEAERYPYITFESETVRQVAADEFLAVGDLTIKGETRRVELPIKLLGVKPIPEGMREMLGGVTKVASFETSLDLDRRDFGVGVGSWAETAIVGPDVEVAITVEANQT